MAEHPLSKALREGNTEAASSIINTPDFNPNVTINQRIIFDYPNFPLVLAATIGNAEIVRLLIEKGVDLATQGTDALFSAIGEAGDYRHRGIGHVNVVRLLIAQPEIDINAIKMWSPDNPLHRAIKMHANIEIIKLLLAHGADVNKKDSNGDTPLIIALNNEPHYFQEYTNQLLDVLLQNTTLNINETGSRGNALQAVEHSYYGRNPSTEAFYSNVIMKLLAHGAVHPNKHTHKQMVNGDFTCKCYLYGNSDACSCKTMGALRFLKNRRNATWKRRRAALTAWHGAHAHEFEIEEQPAVSAAPTPAADAVHNNGSSSVQAALKAFRNLGYHVGTNTRKRTNNSNLGNWSQYSMRNARKTLRRRQRSFM